MKKQKIFKNAVTFGLVFLLSFQVVCKIAYATEFEGESCQGVVESGDESSISKDEALSNTKHNVLSLQNVSENENQDVSLEDIAQTVNEQSVAETIAQKALDNGLKYSENEFDDKKSGVLENDLAVQEELDFAVEADIEDEEQIGEFQVGIKVPEGFAVEFGTQSSYVHSYISCDKVLSDNIWVYNLQTQEKTRTVKNPDTGVSEKEKYTDVKNATYFYRVYSKDDENKDAVTYWGWISSSDCAKVKGTTLEVTEEMLCLNDDSKRDSNTVDEFLENNDYDTQDILITGNQDGYINLVTGQTWNLNCYRMWEIVESYTNAQISQPDFHIKAHTLATDENPDGEDVVKITKNSGSGAVNTIEAVRPGTVILTITYDALTVKGAMGGERFSAIAPENTATFVVKVTDVESAPVNDGIDLDCEVDVQYYSSNEGATVVALPDEGSTVRVSRCGYNFKTGEMELGIFEEIKPAEDGSFVISNLTEGSSVVEIKDSTGNTAYQVIKAKQICFQIKDMDGNIYLENPTEDELKAGFKAMKDLKAGDKITVTADKFYDVFMKSSGVYNGSAALQLTDNFGNVYRAKENASGFSIAYTQAKDVAYRTVEITLPEGFDPATFTLDCSVYRDTRFGLKLTGHRTVYKNSNQKALNGYFVTYNTAQTQSKANEILNSDTELLREMELYREKNMLLDEEILEGEVITVNNDPVEYFDFGF